MLEPGKIALGFDFGIGHFQLVCSLSNLLLKPVLLGFDGIYPDNIKQVHGHHQCHHYQNPEYPGGIPGLADGKFELFGIAPDIVLAFGFVYELVFTRWKVRVLSLCNRHPCGRN